MKLLNLFFCVSLCLQLWLTPFPVWAAVVEPSLQNLSISKNTPDIQDTSPQEINPPINSLVIPPVDPLQKTKKTNSRNLTELFDLAIHHTQMGNYQLAVQEFTQVIAQDKAKTSAYLNRCFANLQLENYLESLTDCTVAIDLDPQAKEAYLHRGLVNYRLERYPQALLDYDRLIVLNPQDFRAYYNRGLVKVAIRNFTEAIADYNQALKVIPSQESIKVAMVYNDRGLAYFQQGDINQAQADFNHALALDRRDARSYYNLGCICHHQGAWQKAIYNFTLALGRDPNQPDAYRNRAIMYQHLGDFPSAIADLYAAAKGFRHQGEVTAYEQTMELLEAIEQEQLGISETA